MQSYKNQINHKKLKKNLGFPQIIGMKLWDERIIKEMTYKTVWNHWFWIFIGLNHLINHFLQDFLLFVKKLDHLEKWQESKSIIPLDPMFVVTYISNLKNVHIYSCTVLSLWEIVSGWFNIWCFLINF
jgi:hypothetical protein